MASKIPDTFICKGCRKEFLTSGIDTVDLASTDQIARAASGDDPDVGIYCEKCMKVFNALRKAAGL